jgi:hypothetical protein
MPARAATLLVALALAGCTRDRPAAHPDRGAEAAVDDAEPAVTTPDRVPVADHPAGECRDDADCAVLPPVTWCGECRPAPPFEAGTRAELDALLIEAEQQCAAEAPRAVEPCPPVPTGCAATAACVDTRCAAVAHGC